MEPINKGEAITLDNNKEYYVVDIIYDNGKKYVYLISDDEEVILGEEKTEYGEVSIETLDDQDKIAEILSKIIENK